MIHYPVYMNQLLRNPKGWLVKKSSYNCWTPFCCYYRLTHISNAFLFNKASNN